MQTPGERVKFGFRHGRAAALARGSLPAQIPLAERVSLERTAHVAHAWPLSARDLHRLREPSGLSSTEQRTRVFEADEAQHDTSATLAERLGLDDLHVARMIVEPEQRHALRGERKRRRLAQDAAVELHAERLDRECAGAL